MQVKVYHTAFEETPVHIATVDTPCAVHTEACEYAYRWTQNIMDSWSKNMPADGNDLVTVVEPLHVDESGNEWGHRSSAMGDHFLVDGTLYKCAAVGFEPAEKIECRQPF